MSLNIQASELSWLEIIFAQISIYYVQFLYVLWLQNTMLRLIEDLTVLQTEGILCSNLILS